MYAGLVTDKCPADGNRKCHKVQVLYQASLLILSTLAPENAAGAPETSRADGILSMDLFRQTVMKYKISKRFIIVGIYMGLRFNSKWTIPRHEICQSRLNGTNYQGRCYKVNAV